MSELLRFFKDMRDNGYGLAEIAAQLGTSAIAEPVAGFAAMYDPAHGADAIREGMTYQPPHNTHHSGCCWSRAVALRGRLVRCHDAGVRRVPVASGIEGLADLACQ